MTRRLVATALLAGALGMLGASAEATHDDARACIGGDHTTTGRMVGYCLNEDPLAYVREIIPV